MNRSLFFFLFASPLAAQSDIDNFSAATNDRFANDPLFIANAFDLSGVGRTDTPNAGIAPRGGRWATLIADNIFLTAHHYPANTGNTVYFYPDNDPSTPAVTRVVAGTMRVPGTDLRIGHFTEALPATIKVLPFVDTDFASSGLLNDFAYTAGLSETITDYGAFRPTSTTIGENRVEGFAEDGTIGGLPPGDMVFAVKNESLEPGYQTYEALLNLGDSGSPLLVVDGGELLVAGIARLTATLDIDPGPEELERDVSFYTYTGSYADKIDVYIAANLVERVPEPAVSLLFLLSGLAFLQRRRY